MAHPLAQPAEDLVALDDWVRGGGRVLLLADPMLEWPSKRPLGDPLRPPADVHGHRPARPLGAAARRAGRARDRRRERWAAIESSPASPGRLFGGCAISGRPASSLVAASARARRRSSPMPIFSTSTRSAARPGTISTRCSPSLPRLSEVICAIRRVTDLSTASGGRNGPATEPKRAAESRGNPRFFHDYPI